MVSMLDSDHAVDAAHSMQALQGPVLSGLLLWGSRVQK
jgi:hypothetical protein